MTAWVKPTRKGEGEAHLLGEGMSQFAITYYNTQLCHFYIGSGGNHLKDYLTMNKWQHVAASFDGKRMKMWIDGRVVGGRDSDTETILSGGTFHISSAGPPDMPRFKGLIDNVRLYHRGITDEEVLKLVTAEAQDHDLGVMIANPASAEATVQFFHEHPNPIDHREVDNRILLANDRIGIEFHRSDTGFQLSGLYDIANRHDFLARVVDYYKNPTTREFLAYGRLVRPLEFESPDAMPMLEYAKGWTVPALSSGVFLSEAGELCVFVVNASRDEQVWKASIDPMRYGLPEGAMLQVEEIEFDGKVGTFEKSARGALNLEHSTPGGDSRCLTSPPCDLRRSSMRRSAFQADPEQDEIMRRESERMRHAFTLHELALLRSGWKPKLRRMSVATIQQF